MSVRAMEAGREVKRVAGREFKARTGMRQRDTQVAWAKKAMRKEGGEVRILSKRESEPSAEMRRKRYVPTVRVLIIVSSQSFGVEK